MDTTDRLLPKGFEALEPFVADWVLADAVARMSKRQASRMEDIRRFYEAMLPLGERALEHLRQFELGEVPAASERLLKLMLSLAEVAPAVEWYGDPRVNDGFPIERIRYRRQIPDAAPQT
ncbi:hypothetical protein LJR219_004516 [Phenylobacterium sp. LjRoot219]|uniref:hypothetical protein n=1 Tax=Phenylobacterium sp. LjRoot219 TaxID=3342283 RepID=UPI003ED0D316